MMHRGGTRETIPVMTSPQTIERVRELRQRGRTPKEIARALGLPPAAVAPLIRVVAAAQPAREAALVGCWVSEGWEAGLTVTGHPEWPGAGATAESGQSGLVSVLVARETGKGKPTYIQGPHDDAARVIRTLRRSVGDDNPLPLRDRLADAATE
jgi:hypothetical protein